MVKAWANCPLPIIPKDERLRGSSNHKPQGICQNCNRITALNSTTYQLCASCSDKFRYYGITCDVPNCKSFGDGLIKIVFCHGKYVCGKCDNVWSRKKYNLWEEFVEHRHIQLSRPEPFITAEAEGLIIKVNSPVKTHTIAECSSCKREVMIYKSCYQLCDLCSRKYRYYGETCQCCNFYSARGFDDKESIFYCDNCSQRKNTYGMTYHFYKTQLRTIINCMVCGVSVSHNKLEGEDRCSAYIDHDHKTNTIRGILCAKCNVIEGMLDKLSISAETYALNLMKYLTSLSIGNTQKE